MSSSRPALKRKIFGLKRGEGLFRSMRSRSKKYLAGDSIDRARVAYAGDEDPAFRYVRTEDAGASIDV